MLRDLDKLPVSGVIVIDDGLSVYAFYTVEITSFIFSCDYVEYIS